MSVGYGSVKAYDRTYSLAKLGIVGIFSNTRLHRWGSVTLGAQKQAARTEHPEESARVQSNTRFGERTFEMKEVDLRAICVR